MPAARTHSITVEDGAQIAGRVHGDGPNLVFVHGAMEDGDSVWGELVPLLSGVFTCYLMDTRGFGSSSDHPDVTPPRLARDVAEYAQSVGGLVGVVAESGGCMWALGAAAETNVIAALALHEPVVLEAQTEAEAEGFQQIIAEMKEPAAGGRPTEAARIFFESALNEDEQATLFAGTYLEESARYVESQLREFDQLGHPDGYSPTDPLVLAQVRASMLLLSGSRSALSDWMKRGIYHLRTHAPDVSVIELEGSGHGGPILAPQPIAEALRDFFGRTLRSS
jgi:pimeloyl-ACP methyl ester carboxylesterase